MTKSRLLVLAAIAQMIAEEGIPPTLREIAARTRLSLNAVYYQVGCLVAGGYLASREGAARSLRVLPAGKRELELGARRAAS